MFIRTLRLKFLKIYEHDLIIPSLRYTCTCVRLFVANSTLQEALSAGLSIQWSLVHRSVRRPVGQKQRNQRKGDNLEQFSRDIPLFPLQFE